MTTQLGARSDRQRGAKWHAIGSALAAIASWGIVGCTPYEAQIGREVQRGEVRVRMESARAIPRNSARIHLVVQNVPPGVVLLGAAVSGSPDALCGEGFQAVRLGRDGGRSVDEPLVRGESIALEFTSLAVRELSGESPRLDLLVQTSMGSQRCVPLPLASAGQELDWKAKKRWTVGLDLGLEGFTTHLGAVSQVVPFPLLLGVWVGDYHIEVGGGFVSAGCPDTRCDTGDDTHIDYAGGSLLQAGVGRTLYEKGELAFGANLRYRAMHLAADTREGREQFWTHGPVLAPYFAAVTPIEGGKHPFGGSRDALIGLEVPVGYAFAETGKRSVTVGVNLRLLMTLF